MPDLNPLCHCVEEQIRFCKMCQDACLRPISDNDLFDPPNIVEAFNRLIAAMDPVKSRFSAELTDDQVVLLDPPTTAARFARIEAAIESSLAKPIKTHSGLRRPARFSLRSKSCSWEDPRGIDAQHGVHRLRKRPSHLAMLFTTSESVAAQGNDVRGFGPGWAADGPDVSSQAATSPTSPHARAAHSGKGEFQQDVDIFRNSATLREFTAQTYLKAREKYM